jgi:hypothetical protein
MLKLENGVETADSLLFATGVTNHEYWETRTCCEREAESAFL